MSSESQSSPTTDRALLLPILLGLFSLCGILLVLTLGRFRSDRSLAPAADTPTPFQYQLIGTEPGVSTADPATGESAIETADGASNSPAPALAVTAQQGVASDSNSSGGKTDQTKTSSSVIQTAAGNGTDPIIVLNPGSRTATSSLIIIERSHTPTRTPGPTLTITPSRTRVTATSLGGSVTGTPTTVATGPTQVPLGPGTYDDSHPLFAYKGWTSVTEPSAYQNTLHVSNQTGSTITFRFIGHQFILTHQSSTGFGNVEISFDGLLFIFDQSAGTTEYVSRPFPYGTHTVILTHDSGGSVNIDSIIIPNTPTATSSQ